MKVELYENNRSTSAFIEIPDDVVNAAWLLGQWLSSQNTTVSAKSIYGVGLVEEHSNCPVKKE